MNAIALSRCIDDVMEAIEANQDSCKALNLARDKAIDTVASADVMLVVKHKEYDALVFVKESLLEINGISRL
jgi:hypothetical protein